MPEEYEESGMPLFIINGFLEAGKTQFLRFTIAQDYFQTDGKTLMLVCEEGVEEFPKDLLEKTHTTLIQIDNIEDMRMDKLQAIVAAHNPERVIIEWNGMWPMSELRIPDDWFLNQQITIIDASTLDMYLKNMKPLMGQMLRFTELVICNRCDGISEEVLGSYYMQLKAMAQNAEIIFEGKDGEIKGDFNIELPYDINADVIEIGDDDFGIFYVDTMDRPERYDGLTVEFTGQILKPRELPNSAFVPGRMVMTCCEADMQFLGHICYYGGIAAFKEGDWVKVRAKIKAQKHPMYGGMGPVLYAESLIRTGKIDKPCGF